jgi:hypothetical protein
MEWLVTLGQASNQLDLLDPVTEFCDETLPSNSIFGFLHRERDNLFPDGMFTDLFATCGRRSVPPSVVATVMVLQRLEGLSDREAVERFCFDARWRYATGVGGWDGAGRIRFVHTVLVDMRQRLRDSQAPDRVFEVGLTAARAAGLIGRKRVLDSTPLYDAVATMDTITLIRCAMRGLLATTAEADPVLAERLRACLTSGDDYTSTGKPRIDWDNKTEREALIDSRAKDAHAVLAALHGQQLPGPLAEAGQLLAAVLGQDLDEDTDGVFRIARRVARDRIISTVDPEARHGHKTAARGFDGYKGHIAADPDSEIITATEVTPGNSGDAEAAETLLTDVLPPDTDATTDDTATTDDASTDTTTTTTTDVDDAVDDAEPTADDDEDQVGVYGDAAYGAGSLLKRLEDADIHVGTKVQPPAAPGGRFSKDHFDINLDEDTVTCPNGVTTPIGKPDRDGNRTAAFGAACATCPLAAQCTTAASGRTVTIGPYEAQLANARTQQGDPAWRADYRATRPKVERKLAHLMRRRHGGRRARVRGRQRVAQDFNWLAAATNLARLATLGLTKTTHGWRQATA